ncbi:hypothetical protein BABINDRAFT_32382 [Babjeviella inositovora NRRL Y-12698]|uniref:YCII-related domain-containing protein n=1 Tax=Babjeviella inositovora NRRL Y-12698 TaxID=984486 RepID=A0A1E3QWX6_9ASCO|nr:uncharacterized protein BABINDRAFT_32382 [Babjeviella inositovora NRRL Y-12698]ODQ82014.1 hypothetical protein BABINDRAFT_32382 [Babjeviella inositovora NRRL Y-12698]
MSTEWLVVVRDTPVNNRMEHRPQHFADSPPKFTANGGKVIMGGGIFNSDKPLVADGSQPLPPFAGSAFVIRAESKQEVIDFLKQDVYAREKVWDMDNLEIWPYLCAYREEKTFKA